MKVYTLFLIALFSATSLISTGQEIILEDDFESSDSNLNWQAFDVNAVFGVSNPYSTEQNTSEGVMSYSDFGALYGNVSFDTSVNFDLTDNSTFSLKIYIPSDELTGDQENQISLKLQNANLDQPWQTQCEIIKPLLLDQWQTVSFDFSTDDYINLNNSSPAPTDRFDFNRVLLQVNGENNTDQVMAFIDDFAYDGVLDLDANPTNSIYTNLVWADEFETDGAINSEKWFHQTLLPNGWGWFNNEQQHYTDRIENSFVDDGNLHIVAKSETFSDQGVTKDYTSARLNSKFAFTYGRVVARAILPEGAGTWPAIWMLGKNINENGGYWQEEFGTTGWPECGEIDIMEHWGNNQNVVSAALHTPSSFGATENYGTIFDDNVSQDYHIYEMEWSPEEIKFSLDGSVYYIYSPAVQNAETWPFTEDQYLLLNFAIQENISPFFEEDAMILDYIRVYQEGNPTSVNEVEKSKLNVYPNPANDYLVIETPNNDLNAEIEIYTLLGVKVLSQKVSAIKTRVSLNEFPKGAYLTTVRTNSGVFNQTFIVSE